MSGRWWVVIVGGTVLTWSLYYDSAHNGSDRLAQWWVARARRGGRRSGPCAFLISLAALLAYGLAVLVGAGIAHALGDVHWALVTTIPAMLTYGPFVIATIPVETSSPYRYWRQSLESEGASASLQRAIAWWAGPPSILGMIVMITTLFSIFLFDSEIPAAAVH